MKVEQIECSETSAYKIETPGNCPKENILYDIIIIIIIIIITEIQLSLGGSSPYTSTDKTNKNKCIKKEIRVLPSGKISESMNMS